MSDISERQRLRARAAQIAESQPGFLGATFARYCEIEEVGRAEVAQRLSVNLETLDALAICRLPRPERFASDVAAIAFRFGANPTALATVLREVAAVDALADDASGGWLKAARDADDTGPPESKQ